MANVKQKFVFELGLGVTLKDKKALQKIVEDLNGEVSYLLSKTVNFLVTTSELLAKGGYKIDTAKKYDIHIITTDELREMKPIELSSAPGERQIEQIGGVDIPGGVRDGSGASSSASSASSAISSPRVLNVPTFAPLPTGASNLAAEPTVSDEELSSNDSKPFVFGDFTDDESDSDVDSISDVQCTAVGAVVASSAERVVASDGDNYDDDNFFGLFGGDGDSIAPSSPSGLRPSLNQPILPLPIILPSSTVYTASPRSRVGSIPATPKSSQSSSKPSSPLSRAARKSKNKLPAEGGNNEPRDASPAPAIDEAAVFWHPSKEFGWRKKGTVVAKKVQKVVTMKLTQEEIDLMKSLDASTWPTLFPSTSSPTDGSECDDKHVSDADPSARLAYAAPLMAMPPGVVLDSKLRSKTFENKSVSIIDPNASWVAVVKNDPSIRKKIIPPSYAGQKIFIGGITFQDIIEKSLPSAVQKQRTLERLKTGYRTQKIPKKKLEKKMASLNPDVWDAEKVKMVRELRIERIKRLCENFGPVIDFQEHWADGYLFVTYKNKDDAESALKTLKHSETRKGLCRDIKEKLRGLSKDALGAPRADFYVRWPEYYTKQKAKKKAAKKEKLAGLKEAAAKAAKPDKKRRRPKKTKKEPNKAGAGLIIGN